MVVTISTEHQKLLDALNEQHLDDFEGLSPYEMHGLLYTPFNEKRSCLRLNNNIDEKYLSDAYFVRDIKKYLEIINQNQPLKLTAKGNLPRHICRELISVNICEQEEKWFENHPIMKEEDSMYINLINIFTQLNNMVKKKKNKMSLTKKGILLMNGDYNEFYTYLFRTYCEKFNWGYSDRYPESWIIQASFPFSIHLLQKYGNHKRKLNFYVGKMLRAFPNILNKFKDPFYNSREEYFQRCYGVRVFERFLFRFGMISISSCEKRTTMFKGDYDIQKKKLIDEFIIWDRKWIQKEDISSIINKIKLSFLSSKGYIPIDDN